MTLPRIFLTLIFVLLLVACSPVLQSPPPEMSPTPETISEAVPSSTLSVDNPAPTSTPTPDAQVVVLTPQQNNIILTAMNLQLADNQARLTESAIQIQTLSAESAALETQVAIARTQAASSSESASNTESNDGQQNNQKYDLPSNVYTVVTIDIATIFVANSTNDKGALIMEPYKPRVQLPPGTEAWVYQTAITADGGTVFYESYDPDGDVPEFKVYFRESHIQIKPKNSKPNPQDYPSNVARAEIIDRYTLHTPVGYDKQGKPDMEAYKPYIHFDAGERVIVLAEPVIATGGIPYYPVYDPDGKPSGFIRYDALVFPLFWN